MPGGTMSEQTVNWIIFSVVVILIALVGYALLRMILKGRKKAKASSPEEARKDPTLGQHADDLGKTEKHLKRQPGTKQHIDSAKSQSVAAEPDEKLLRQEIRKAGAEAVAESYGEAHQSEMPFQDSVADSSNWDQVVKESFKRRVGVEAQSIKISSKSQKQQKPSERDDGTFVILCLRAPRAAKFDGQAILRTLRRQGLKMTDKHVFELKSCREGTDFYVCPAVRPGLFDVNKIHQFTLPGLNFVIDLDTCPNPKKALDKMLAVVDAMHKTLGGDVLDDRHQRFSYASLGQYYARVGTNIRKDVASA